MPSAGTRTPFFPTRQYPYRNPTESELSAQSRDPFADIPAGSVVRFFLGQDDAAVALDAADIARLLGDPFAQIVLAPGHRPQSLSEVLSLIDAATGAQALTGQRIYRVCDGGQIPWSLSTASLDRHLRLVITRHRGQDAELFISSAPPSNSKTIFLQIFAWDPGSGSYNFYERRRGIWSWAGSSWQALEGPTRGQGPFDSHVNGGPVMKELKLPWMHWHSQSSQIRNETFAPDDPAVSDPVYDSADLRGGEDLELIVRSGTTRWVRSRLDLQAKDGGITLGKQYLRHVLTGTTVNLACSPQPSASLVDGDMLRLPTSFFVNSDCLVDELSLPLTLSRLKAPAAFYREALSRYKVRLQDGDSILERDTYFAFPIPEPSFEDTVVLRELVSRGYLSRKLALCLLLVDFANPIFSDRRASLLAYVPDDLRSDKGKGLDVAVSSAIAAAIKDRGPDSAEAEFIGLWEGSADDISLSEPVNLYWTKIQSRLMTMEGFDDFFRLAESRRRQFRKRPLAEFGLTLPVASALDLPGFLEMTRDAEVRFASKEHSDATV